MIDNNELHQREPPSFTLEGELQRTLALILDEVSIRNSKLRLEVPQKQAEQLERLQNTMQNDAILSSLADCLVKSQDQIKQRLLRLIPDRVLRIVLDQILLKKNDLSLVLEVIGLVLQQTDNFNLPVLAFLLKEEVKSQVQKILTNATVNLIKALVRCVVAQPLLCDLWDFSSLVTVNTSMLEGEIGLLVEHLKIQLAHPNSDSGRSEARIKLVDSLMLNKTEELRCKLQLHHSEYEEDCTTFESERIVCTNYLYTKASQMILEMERAPFGHFCVSGPPGSGKMSLIQIVNQMYFQRYGTFNASIVITLESTFDSKNLVGTYVCNETGEFQFKKGPLTVAAESGMWLILRNIEDAPSDLLSFLLPIIQENILQVTSTMTIRPKLGFRIFILQRNQQLDDRIHYQQDDIQPVISLMYKQSLESLISDDHLRPDFVQILEKRFPSLFIEIYPGFSLHILLQRSIKYLTESMSQLRPHLLDFRPYTIHQLLQVYTRVDSHFQYLHSVETKHISQAQRQLIAEEISDVYLGFLYDVQIRQKLIHSLVQSQFNLNFDGLIDGESVGEYCVKLGREFGISNQTCFFGRITMNRTDDQSLETSFVYTGATVRLLEQISASIKFNEPTLLVGETGTGKTTAVQELSKVLGKKLHVFNMNQNTDSADLMGGFKPVDLKYLLKPIYELFLSVFTSMFEKTPNNQKFLDLTQKCYQANRVKEFLQCIQHGFTSIKSKKDKSFANEISKLERQLKDLQKRSKKLESSGGFVFQFVEGALIKSMQNGDWVLLDEINLASESVLNRLATIIQGDHVLLNERADVIDLKVHSDFRLFMCMNPPYSSAGKKQLPKSLRLKVSEVYVPELENESDLWSIIDKYTRQNQHNIITEEQKRQILNFYVQIKQQVQKQTKRGNIGLRNLCRSLRFMNAAMNLKYPPLKAIYDSLYTCFASHLDTQLQETVKQTILQLFKIRSLPKLAVSGRQKDERFAYIEDSLVVLGSHQPQNFDSKNFILTQSFRNLVQQLASVISVSNFAVILEGPTSAGKTSCINYLAAVTHNHVIRINNHMHTDVQEYIGSYVPDADSGKLTFQEGILVEAVRKGYWVILDELNLAPSEVLEALNRLLDDNRELHIVETQKVIKAHPAFRIFATQNPTEGYGGRKELSEAFKNRFVMIKVRDVPTDELQLILEQKCNLPSSRASLMVKVMENLQIYRSQGSIFAGKESTITVRDLLKWAGRVNLNSATNIHMDQYFIALEGFLVLGERSRDLKDKKYIKEAIEKVFGVTLNVEAFYDQFFENNLSSVFANIPLELNLPPIVISKQLRRLATLVYKCLLNKEPVLLVGETGCGKTTLCQVIAHSVTKQQLFAINCHQNTETSDFIGCMRTRKNLSQVQESLSNLLDQAKLTPEQRETSLQLSLKKRARFILQITQDKEIEKLLDDLSCVFEWTDGILVNAMQQGGLLLIDEISLANDSVLERLNSVFEYDRTLVISEKSSVEAVRIVAAEKFNMVATMNPGSDFGKKELSPALRNRMTEIWVESYFSQSELVQLARNYSDSLIPTTSNLLGDIDLYLIINQLCQVQLSPDVASKVAQGIFNLICYVNFQLSTKYFSMQRKSLSIRDVINLVQFIKTNSMVNPSLTQLLDHPLIFKHAVELVIIDGLCLGIDVTNQQEQLNITMDCTYYLNIVLDQVFNYRCNQKSEENHFIDTSSHIGVQPFVMQRQTNQIRSSYAFEAETTKRNLMKLLRAFTLGKPVLIEGPPGVGKTSLVENLAKQTGKKLIRVNLSEQTDMMDLLGSEYPIASGVEEDEIKFSWCDGVLLQAIKEGHWFLIDEMNLAQQSILEGLNAILDHRRTVYIPELNREFVCHPDFFVFACQNPSQSSGQTSGRKTLPKSFLNRFAKIYLDDLTQQDYKVILKHQANDLFTEEKIDLLLGVTQQINKSQQHSETTAKVNMRDLSRFLTLHRHFLSSLQLSPLHSAAASFIVCYKNIDIAIQSGFIDQIEIPKASLIRVEKLNVTFKHLHQTVIKPKAQLTTNTCTRSKISFGDYQQLKGEHAKSLHQLCDALHANLPVLLVTNDAQKLQKSLSVLAHLHSTQLRRILLNERSDTTQLLGCFEQTSNDIGQIVASIGKKKLSGAFTQRIYKLEYDIGQATSDQAKFDLVQNFVSEFPDLFSEERNRLKQLKSSASRFEWVDSVLVQSVQEGFWAVFENANLCNPSILDRLNGLLEDGAQALTINEQGLIDGCLREVVKHADFRAIFVVTASSLSDLGKDVSKALRNRCLEIEIYFKQQEVVYFDDLDGKQIQVQPQSLVEHIRQTQDQHDLLPSEQLSTQEDSHVVVSPGSKRANPEVTRQEVSSLKEPQRKGLNLKILKPYEHFLQQLKTIQNENPYLSYLKQQVQETKQVLQRQLDSQIIDRQLQRYLTSLLEANPERVMEFYVYLQSIVDQRILRETNNVAFIVFQAKQFQTKVQLQTSEDLGFVLDQQNVDFQMLKGVQAPDLELIEKTKAHQTLMPHCEVFVYKLPIPYLLSKTHESRFGTIVRQLKFNSATVILINAEKEIVQDQDKIVKHLEETCFDMGTVLELPNLVVIPANINEGVVVISQSYIYESLCFVKDLIKLQNGIVKEHQHMRLSKIPQVVRNTSNQTLGIVLRQITMLNLERSYSSKSYQLNLIKAVVNDEQSISLKDLPAAYACTHSLMYKLQELDKQKQSDCQQQQIFDRLVKSRFSSQVFDPEVEQALHLQWLQTEWRDDQAGKQAQEAMKMFAIAFGFLSELKTVEIIRAMFVLPLELKKQRSIIDLKYQEIEAERFFWEYQYREQAQATFLLQSKLKDLKFLETNLSQLEELVLNVESRDQFGNDITQRNLKHTLQFVRILGEEILKIKSGILNNDPLITTEPLSNLVFKQLDSLQFASVSHLLCDLMTGIAVLLSAWNQIVAARAVLSPVTKTVVGLESDKNVLVEMFVGLKTQEQCLQEQQMKWLLRQGRFTFKTNYKLDSAILEHFVQREVVKRMKVEDKMQDIFKLPFKMREQTIPEPLGKAMDEWTEKDKAKMEAEAEAQIELNFPSYFDEVQKAYFAGEFKRDGRTGEDQMAEETEIEDVLTELLELSVNTEQVYRQSYLRERILVVNSVLEQQRELCHLDYNEWIDDVSCYLSNSLHEQKLKQVMNISDVRLASSYNFYHSPIPSECKLVYQPLTQLLMRLRDITIRDCYESTLLNEAIFLSNYMLTCFNVENTPLMKVLTSIEFLLTKLEEWENTYASKRLNSVETEINQLKLLVIRYRKIQILSWRNLLNWKQEALIREDLTNCIRLAHTMTKQVFEGNEEVIKILDLLDLYMRDSTLGTYKPRLKFLQVLKEHFLNKQQNLIRVTDAAAVRLQQSINCLIFVIAYYSQFKPKLQQTIDRLDVDAREKVKTLIDISKWTLQKFSIMKNNVDRTHRQLNKACKVEEEILIQNVQSLVLVSSRKKFIGQSDQLLDLDQEGKTSISYPKPVKEQQSFELTSIVKQINFLEQSKVLPMWPSCLTLQNAISGFMERLQDVRALNKKYLQKKAFYDLLKFMKDEGLRSNFQTEFQSLLIQCETQSPYFVRAYETFILLKSSSQSDEDADLKNLDVLRVQGFSQHLMHATLETTIKIQSLKKEVKILDFVPKIPASQFASSEEGPLPQFGLRKDLKVSSLLTDFKVLLESFISKAAILTQLTYDSTRQSEISYSYAQSTTLLQQLPDNVQEVHSCYELKSSTSRFIELLQLKEHHSNRTTRVFSETLAKAYLLQARMESAIIDPEMLSAPSSQFTKQQRLLENRTKLFYQDVLKLLEIVNSKTAQGSKNESADNLSTMEGAVNNVQSMIDHMPDLTLEERLKFLDDIKQVLQAHLAGIAKLGKKMLFESKELHTAITLEPTVLLLRKVQRFSIHVLAVENTYLDSMSKFAYLTQRVFLYLIYQGFCGQEESDDPDVEPPSDLEADGMGMGDGKGGENNVTDQIEHEEQLEGLKNYESDDDQKQENDDEEKGDDQNDENDFEMKEDFDGEMDEEQKSNQSQKQDDDDDELDQVDDMLDNQLWNQNMEDMEEKEQKEQEEEKREQDLGQRELQDENMIDKDSQMAEGDHEEREQADPKQEKDQQAEMAEASDEGERDSNDEDQEIGIDNESVPADPEEAFSEESKSDAGQDISEHEDSKEGDNDESLDSKFEEQMEGQEDASGADEEQEQSLDVKNDVNQAVLEDEQIQANEQDQKKNDQANLKRQQQNKVESANNENNKQPDQVDSQQVDPNGNDLLFQFAQKLQQREQNKQQQTKDKEQSKQDTEKKPIQVDDPSMLDADKPAPDQEPEQNDVADEYMFDEQAQQAEGKLAADKVQDPNSAHQEEDVEMREELEKPIQEEQPEDIEMTQQVALNQQQAKSNNQAAADQNDAERMSQHDEEKKAEENQQNLIEEYSSYLKNKRFPIDLTEIDQQKQDQLVVQRIVQSIEQFDYLKQKELIRRMFSSWQSDHQVHDTSIELLAKFKNQTSHITASLCEQLRIVLEPQLSQNLQGDFKTGKRLNMKKVISFIASNYRNDKIWLRRTLPSKRDYKILIAIDDSLSMKESNLGFFSLEASVALGEALNRLEVGKVAVARIRDRLELVHSFEDQYNSERAAHIVSQFDFKHCATTSADTSMSNFVSDANKLLDMQNNSNAVSCPFVIVLSDGRFNKENVRKHMREAKEKRYLYIFVILDQASTKDQSIMSMRSAVKQLNGGIKLEAYLKDFPFDYYCVVQDITQLPSALGTILVQWFSLVSNSS